MNKKTKIWLFAAVLSILAGAIIFTAVMSYNKWDFTKLDTEKYQTKAYEIKEDFNNITIDTDTTDIVFAHSDNNVCRVLCYESEKTKNTAYVKNGTLTVISEDSGKWYEHIGICFNTQKITVFLPKTKYGELYVKNSTGDIEIPESFNFSNIDILTSTGKIGLQNISAEKLNLSVSTGEIKLSDINCNNIISKGSTGNIHLKNVIAKDKIHIERNTGDVRLENSDAEEIFVKTSTGNVTGNLLSKKVFSVKSSTGKIIVPKTNKGGKCEIVTSTGDIVFR